MLSVSYCPAATTRCHACPNIMFCTSTYTQLYTCSCIYTCEPLQRTEKSVKEFKKQAEKAACAYSDAVFHPEDINRTNAEKRHRSKQIKLQPKKLYSHRRM
jgi:hypothetical protein